RRAAAYAAAALCSGSGARGGAHVLRRARRAGRRTRSRGGLSRAAACVPSCADAKSRQRSSGRAGGLMAGSDVAGVLATHFADPSASWSVGTFGAIAEFMRDPHELAVLESTDGALSAATGRGAICIRTVADLRLVASESTTKESWNQRVALCLPDDRCAMHRRSVLTELGPDAEAIRESDRAAILFDLGLAALQVDGCVRVSDPVVVAQLRMHCGKGLLESNNPSM